MDLLSLKVNWGHLDFLCRYARDDERFHPKALHRIGIPLRAS